MPVTIKLNGADGCEVLIEFFAGVYGKNAIINVSFEPPHGDMKPIAGRELKPEEVKRLSSELLSLVQA